MNKQGKTIIITEEEEEKLVSMLLAEAYTPKPGFVRAVKEFLDTNVMHYMIDTIDIDGYPTKEKTYALMSKTKQPLMPMNKTKIIRMLDDKFHNKISDDGDRKKVLERIFSLWSRNSLPENGMLDVNYL